VRVIHLLRKPLAASVAQNIIRHGTGALHTGACTMPYESELDLAETLRMNVTRKKEGRITTHVYAAGRTHGHVNPQGRWPTNLILGGDDVVRDVNRQDPAEIPEGITGAARFFKKVSS
jgi:hypothetical protein